MTVTLRFLLLSLFMLISLIGKAAVSDRALGAEDREALSQWGSRRMGFGNLLTPPRGKIASEVQDTQKFISNLVHKLIVDHPELLKLNLVINVYGSETPNAFASQISANQGLEKQWLKDHKSAWPVRKLLGINNEEPIYEIGVTTSLLRLVNTEDELAFVLGHELSHISEGHTLRNGSSMEDYSKQWWSTQSHEVTADQLGLEKIAGKYNLDDAIVVMEKLLMNIESSALAAAGSTHHDEGERISLLQGKIIDLKREKITNQIRISEPLSSKYKLNVGGRSDGYSAKYQEWAQRNISVLISEVLSDEGKPWLWSLGHWMEGPDYIKEYRELWFGHAPNEIQRAETFWTVLGAIQASQSSPHQKVEAVFKSINILFDNNKQIFWKSLGRNRVTTLTRFLWENAKGPQGWNSEKSFQSMMSNRVNEGTYYENNSDLFLDSNEGQAVLVKLASTNENWQKMLSLAPEMMLVGGSKTKKEFSIWSYWIKKISGASKFTEFQQQLSMVFQKSAAKIIYQLPESEWLGPDVVNLFKDLQEFAQGTSEKVQNRNLLNIFSQIGQTIQSKASIIIKNELSRPVSRNAQKRIDLLASMNALSPLTVPQLHEFSPTLLKLVQSQLEGTWPLSVNGASECPDKVLLLAERVLSSSKFSYEQQIQLLKYSGALGGLAILGKSEAVRASFSLTMEEVIQFMQAPVPSIVNTAERSSEPKTTTEMNENLQLRRAYISSTMGILDYVSARPESFEAFKKDLHLTQIRKVVAILYKLRKDFLNMAKESKRGVRYDVHLASLDSNSGRLLLEAILLHQSESSNFETWYTLLEQINHLSLGVLDSRAGYRLQVEKKLLEELAQRNSEQKRKLLERRLVRENLTNSDFAQQLFEIIKDDPRLAGQPEKIKQQMTEWESQWELSTKYPDATKTLKNLIAREYATQPYGETEIFPEFQKSLTEKTNILSAYLRGLGGLAAELRTHSPLEQIEFIEYIMGHRQEIPVFVEEAYKKEGETKNLFAKAGITNLRRRLKTETVLTRTLVANSFLAGPHAVTGTEAGQKFLIDHLLNDFRSENKEVAKILATSLMESRGKMKSLGFAFLYGQFASEKTDPISKEATILNSLFNAHGVPGIKFGQYLGFTDSMREYQEAFESLQDAAMPLSYLEMLDLIESQFGAKWNKNWIVKKILGTGSVNVAIEIQNLQTGASEVIVLARKNIETVTQDDFYNFNRFLQALTRSKINSEKFGFLLGLSNIIQRSVELEFDKQHAFDVQKQVQKLYNRSVDGWKIQTVDAFEVGKAYIRMEKGLGVGARMIKDKDPKSYRSAMKALSRVEMDVLTGMDQTGNPNPVALIANPDFHDGQVLIDVVNKRVTILDFGQAVSISNLDRNLSVEVLAIINGLASKRRAKEFLQEYGKTAYRKKIQISDREIEKMYQSPNSMDIFIRMISLTSRHGIDLPLSSIHWILGINRQVKLGNKIDLPIQKYVRNLLLVEKVGGSLKNYNQLKLVVRKIGSFWNPSQQEEKRPVILMCKEAFL